MTDRPPAPAIFFLSDYGTADEYVGLVHAVLHREAPGVPVIDLSHQIPPFDVAAGAALLERSAPFVGAGVVLAVVDPGVGTSRRAVAVAVRSAGAGPAWLVGPDNGLLMPMAATYGGPAAVIDLAPGGRPDPAGGDGPGPTFDGRDLFAPAAAHLVRGGDPATLGPAVDPGSLVAGPAPPEHPVGGGGGPVPAGPGGPEVRTAVASVDRFGNVQLGVGAAAMEPLDDPAGGAARVTVVTRAGEHTVPVRRVRAFGELEPGQLGLLVDSTARLAVVLDRASAAAHLGVDVGAEVVIRGAGPDDG